VVAFNLGYEFDFTLLVLAAVAGLFYYIGFVLERAECNWFVGIRTPWTLESDAVWQRTHRLGGRLFKLTALFALVALVGAACRRWWSAQVFEPHPLRPWGRPNETVFGGALLLSETNMTTC